MKKILIAIIAIIALAATEGFLTTLNITKGKAHMAIWDSFSYGNYAGPTAKTYHSFAIPLRVAMVKEIGSFAIAYSQTDDFKKRYSERREGRKPQGPEPYVPLAVIRKKMHDTYAEGVKDTESKLNTYTGDTRKIMEESVKQLKQIIAEIDDPKNPLYTAEAEVMMKEVYAERMKDYQNDVAKWEKENPVSPHDLIKERLTYFLQLSSTVDFNAKLKLGPDKKMMVFVNEEYEGKDSDWKYIFRSGREATDAARGVATQWLAEIK